jgi:hypothetical protein
MFEQRLMDNHMFTTKGAKVVKEYGIIVGLHGLSGLPCPTCKRDTGFNPWNSGSWDLVRPMGRDMPDVKAIADCKCRVCVASNKMSSSDRYFHRKVLCMRACFYNFKCELATSGSDPCGDVMAMAPQIEQAKFEDQLSHHYRLVCVAETKCDICSDHVVAKDLRGHYSKHALEFATKFVNKEFPAELPTSAMQILSLVADPWQRALEVKAEVSRRDIKEERAFTTPASLLAFFHAAGREVYPTLAARMVMKSQCWDVRYSTLPPFGVLFGKYYRKEEGNNVVVLDG